jgi:membrane-associated phospholipid phosphatase
MQDLNRPPAKLTVQLLHSLALLATLLLVANAAHAQTQPAPTPTPTSTPTLEHEFFKNILHDQGAIWTAPFHLHNRDARWLAPLSLGAGALLVTDQEAAEAIHDNRTRLNVSRDVSYLGAPYGAGSIAAVFYLYGRAHHDARARETGLLAGEALIDSSIIVGALKLATERRRPRSRPDAGEFFTGGNSFPSGHAISAWSVATVVAHEYHDRPLVQVAAYGLASAVSVARYTGRNHFPSDILVGSALGYGIGRYVYRTHHRQTTDAGGGDTFAQERSKLWPLVAPHYDRQARIYGATLAWNF